jgi:hypothetical protein
MKGLRNRKDVERSGDCGLVLLSQHLPEEWRKTRRKENSRQVSLLSPAQDLNPRRSEYGADWTVTLYGVDVTMNCHIMYRQTDTYLNQPYLKHALMFS